MCHRNSASRSGNAGADAAQNSRQARSCSANNPTCVEPSLRGWARTAPAAALSASLPFAKATKTSGPSGFQHSARKLSGRMCCTATVSPSRSVTSSFGWPSAASGGHAS